MLNHAKTGLIFLTLFEILSLAGCGNYRPTPTAPSAPTGATLSPAPGAPPASAGAGFRNLQGAVVDTAYRPLAGARVEAIGASASATTDADGRYWMSGNFDDTTQVRATSTDHNAVVIDAPRSGGSQRTVIFFLQPTGESVDIAGEYNLTFTADTACTGLPEEIRTRHYTASIRPVTDPRNPPNSFSVTVHGTASGIAQVFSSIGVAGHDLGFDLSANDNGTPTLVEQVTQDTLLSYLPTFGLGDASVAPGSPTIATSFDGVIDVNHAGAHMRCTSTRHQVRLTRR